MFFYHWLTKGLGDERIFYSNPPCCQPEHHTSVRAYDILFILARSTHISQISATSNGFHQRIEHHHCLRADSISLLVHWTTEYLSPISSTLRHRPSGLSPLRYPVTSISNSYSSSSHFFILHSYHTRCFFLHSSPPFTSLRRWRLLERKVEECRETCRKYSMCTKRLLKTLEAGVSIDRLCVRCA